VGQKTHPTGLRLGIVKGWDSNWFGGNNYADKLIEDEKIRKYIHTRLANGGISKIVIERTFKRLIITIQTARPGIVIGKGGAEVEALKEEIKKLADKDVQIYIYEVKRPEVDAKLIADNICQQLKARISFRRAMKSAIAAAMRMGAEGVKVQVSGCVGGSEMSRMESYKEGRVPLQTLRADIDYALSVAPTISGLIGVKVWVFKGEVFGKVDLSPEALHNANQRNAVTGNQQGGQSGRQAGRNEKRGGGGRNDGGKNRRRQS
jgi:small subunit ribosomal protein S3